MDKATALAVITGLVETTNNGKLMLKNIPREARSYVGLLVSDRKLRTAQFIEYGDSVRLA